ncbi:glycosyltransferase family 4 protein [Olivibacter sp. XZL3]|uniref:glycosyltransferase family 4 protein n=1 Tax=Olivibacter sp. XZL3 TaxID=1735116 RepID=UPI001065EA10|nr:glycosyltransferase family 4 protein [Olivibacter sp. XZL3]
MMCKLAFVVPSLANKGPILVVRDIISNLNRELFQEIVVFYFDEIEEPIEVPAQKRRISFFGKESFSEFNVIHTHGLRPDLYVRKNRRFIKCFCLSTTHNIVKEEYSVSHNFLLASFVEKLWVYALKKHDSIVTLTHYMERYYKALLPKIKTVVIHNGRALPASYNKISKEDDSKLKTLKESNILIGSTCFVTRRKGLSQVIRALPSLPGYAFVLVGDGPYLENLRRLASQLKVDDRCLFLGSRREVLPYLSYFDIYAMVSYAEGVPLALLEAASIGLPAVCSDIPVHREMFNDNEVRFFNVTDLMSLQKAILSANESKSKLSVVIKEAYDNRFTPKIMASKYENVYLANWKNSY